MNARIIAALNCCICLAAVPDKHTLDRLQSIPIYFEPNQGQCPAPVRFHSPGLLLAPAEAQLIVPGSPSIRMRLAGANANARMTGAAPLPGHSNYLFGNDPAKWQTNVPHYARVRAESVYPGIDIIYYSNQRQLEFDFLVSPGANPARIRLKFEGANPRIDSSGDLILENSLRLHKPLIYQERNGARVSIPGSFQLDEQNQVGFAIGEYDPQSPLIIDPVLSYSTLLTAGYAWSGGVAVDGSGNIYLTGGTNSSFYTTNALSSRLAGGQAAYVAKFNPAGTELLYATFLSGTVSTSGEPISTNASGIGVDRAGRVYIAGITNNRDFPVTPGTLQPLNKGGLDVFIAKLNPNGSALVYSTYLGGSGNETEEFGYPDIAVDGNENAYVAGTTSSRDFPVTPGAFQTAHGGGQNDGFIAKLDPLGSTLVYSTYFGGSGNEGILALRIDSNGDAYVTGLADSANLPKAGALQPNYGGGSYDAFVARLNRTGAALVYSTLLGGDGRDIAINMAVDASGSAYITGYTDSTNFPVTPQAFITTGIGSSAFVSKISPSGAALTYSTLLGGSNYDYGYAIAVDRQGNAIVGGATLSTDFPVSPDAFQSGLGLLRKGAGKTGDAGFLTKLNATGTGILYSTYFGGSGNDYVTELVLDAAENVYIAGSAISVNFPRTFATYEPPDRTDFHSPFLAKFDLANKSSMTLGSVISAASYQTGLSGVVAPGQIVTLFGNEIGPAQLATLQLNSAGRVDTTLAGVRVLFDNTPAPLIYVSARQLSAVVPYSVPQNGRTVVQVEYQGRRSNPLVLWVQPAIVGIFTQNASGRGQGAILNQDGSVNSPSNPAEKGSIVVLFATGEGRTQPEGVDGRVTAEPLPRPLLRIFAQVDNRSAEVLYAGGAPGLVAGVLQMNVRIPEGARSGPDIPIGIGGMDGPFGVELSERVTIAIK